MYKISRKYNIGVDELLELNQKDNFDIHVGEKLIIRKQPPAKEYEQSCLAY